jgi:hypothetical protein
MNALFFFTGGLDLQSNHAKLREFWRLDREIAHWQETKNYKELFHSLEYALMLTRAKQIVKSL